MSSNDNRRVRRPRSGEEVMAQDVLQDEKEQRELLARFPGVGLDGTCLLP